jgi:imidazolonepropionase-like amidohydrolase
MAALRAATLFPAQVMGVDREVGSVDPGKYADVIVVHGNPLQHVNILRDPAIVIKHGIRYR